MKLREGLIGENAVNLQFNIFCVPVSPLFSFFLLIQRRRQNSTAQRRRPRLIVRNNRGMLLTRENRITRKKSVPVRLRLSIIPHVLCWAPCIKNPVSNCLSYGMAYTNPYPITKYEINNFTHIFTLFDYCKCRM
jgi:hypothetical protein